MKPFSCKSLLAGAMLAGLAPVFTGCSQASPDAATGDAAPASGAECDLLVGTYTEGPASSGKSKGAPVFRFDTATGEAVRIADNDGIRNPSWLVVSHDTKFVYAVNELNGTGHAGEVSAFAFDAPSGKLTFLNKVSSQGDDPCHLLLNDADHQLIVSNYTSGSFAILPVRDSGALGEATQTLEHGKNSHVHSAASVPNATGIYIQDLGLDTVFLYARNTETGRYELPADSVPLHFPTKTGPRHVVLDFVSGNNQVHDYYIGELNDSITDDSALLSQTISLGVPVTPGHGTAAAIHLSEDGRFLYASVRNPKNIIVVFAVNPADGRLSEIQTVSSGGKAPREFAIAPGGKFLLVANQQSDAVAVFSRDPETGKITDTGRRIPVGTPVDLKWAPAW